MYSTLIASQNTDEAVVLQVTPEQVCVVDGAGGQLFRPYSTTRRVAAAMLRYLHARPDWQLRHV